MSEHERSSEVVDQGSKSSRYRPSLDELMASIAPLSADELFEIEGVTDDEWQAFEDSL